MVQARLKILRYRTSDTIDQSKYCHKETSIGRDNPTSYHHFSQSHTREGSNFKAFFISSQIELDLSYIVNGARWESSYDVRVDSKTNAIQLVYNGIITNHTSEDWKDVFSMKFLHSQVERLPWHYRMLHRPLEESPLPSDLSKSNLKELQLVSICLKW